MKKLCAFIIFIAFDSYAGLVVNGTRFIYFENFKALSIGVKNTSKETLLVKVNIENSHVTGTNINHVKPPFITMPPLFVVSANKESLLRVAYVPNSNKLPQDKESLFNFTVLAIPSGKPVKNSIQLAIKQNFKLIYRPLKLGGDSENAYRLLVWRKNKTGLYIKNNTAYYVTLYNLKINGAVINNPGVIEPFGIRHEHWCQESLTCNISWSSLSDMGKIMPAVNANVK